MDDPAHVEGVDFTAINPVLEDITYPITAAEFVDRYGDRTLGRTNADPIAVADLFEYMGEDTFESKGDVRQMVLSQMPRNSEGRTNYSDRGGATPMETEAAEAATEQTTADLEPGVSTDPDTTQE
ncbi:hypothetical protein [Haloarcula onubensis]|uniref:DUF2795 domain-containing protein n=1 Tax=Haloarcula onubensis TaxID=2950539 RepID=A0ABU2FSZ8_9EURY|nr:hypothetical protein [Halomicroarcula sp. S3CR25-11]MDS0283281.1 hypothetical protein [Halomicroarcula sp. S3CR25-11]